MSNQIKMNFCTNPICKKKHNQTVMRKISCTDTKKSMTKYFWADEYKCPNCQITYYKCNICPDCQTDESILFRASLYRHHRRHETDSKTNSTIINNSCHD